MTKLTPPHHVSKSRRRFVTFGGALILAACLTLVKMTLVAFEVGERDVLTWSDLADEMASVDAPPPPGTLDDSKFVPWPAVPLEPAAGPADPADDPETPLTETPAMSDPMSAFDPATLTKGQIQVLLSLATRRRELDERERLLDMRAEVNGQTEERLDQQISRLTALKDRIEALMTDLDEAEEQKLARLVKIYETMKPKAAAEIFNRLEMSVLLHVVERMKEAKSAVVLGKMNPAIAERVTAELARRKERPSLGDDGVGS